MEVMLWCFVPGPNAGADRMGATETPARWNRLCDIGESGSAVECKPVTFGTTKFLLDVLKIAVLDVLIGAISNSGLSGLLRAK